MWPTNPLSAWASAWVAAMFDNLNPVDSAGRLQPGLPSLLQFDDR